MKNNKTVIIVLALTLAIALAFSIYLSNSKSNPTLPSTSPDTSSTTKLTYNNTEYGFTFTLPLGWQGYSVITDMWKGNSLVQTTGTNSTSTKSGSLNESKSGPKSESENGPKLILRNPKWTASAPYEDLPILIFTTSQWNAYIAEQFSIGAAPIKATELARNTTYVFALPARWDFDYSLGYEEAQDTMNGSPLRAFEVVE